MKKSKKDPLADLCGEILKSRAPAPRSQRQQVSDFYAKGAPTDQQRANGFTSANEVRAAHGLPQQPRSSFVKSMGQGGIVFDFGHSTGNPVADRATEMLNQFCDPVQEQIARDQRAEIGKAFVEYSRLGEHAYAERHSLGDVMHNQGVHPQWGGQLTKSLDQQVVEMVKREGVGDGGPVQGAGTTGAFNKSTLVVGGAQVVAQSETDAAVIEMMKSAGASLEGDTEG